MVRGQRYRDDGAPGTGVRRVVRLAGISCRKRWLIPRTRLAGSVFHVLGDEGLSLCTVRWLIIDFTE